MMGMNKLGKIATVMSTAMLLLTASACSTNKTQATFDTVGDLKTAFVEAGGMCDVWDQSNKVGMSSQSGTCGTTTVLSVYLSSDAVERRVEATKKSIAGTTGKDWLVGENWIINTADAESFREKLGGRIVSFPSS